MSKTLNNDVLDYLAKILNISFSSTSEMIDDLLDTDICLQLHSSISIETKNFAQYISASFKRKSPFFISSQRFYGGVNGEALFIIDEESTKKLARHLDDFSIEQELSEQHIIDSNVEISNLLTSSCIRKIAQQLNQLVFFSQPFTHMTYPNDIIHDINLDIYSDIILINTVINIDNEKINGHFYILFKEETNEKISQRAALFFEEKQ